MIKQFQIRLDKVGRVPLNRTHEDTRRSMEFHISRKARDAYNFDQGIFTSSGNVILANFTMARTLAKKMNQKRDLVTQPELTIRPAQVNALGLIDEILHHVCYLYREEEGTDLFAEALDFLNNQIGESKVEQTLVQFTEHFPTVAIYQGKTAVPDYLQQETNGVSHKIIALEEMIMLWVANQNPACSPFGELFDDTPLSNASSYEEVMKGIHQFFTTAPVFGPYDQHLLDLLRSPALAVPDSLKGQLEYIKEHWGLWLGNYLLRVLSSLDFIKEEDKFFLKPGFSKAGPQSSLEFGQLEDEPERFSMDKDWMPKVVLLAKSTLVWLDQLSKKYKRDIHRLDQVPDEELNTMAQSGFNGLWLIGLWERSMASKNIKRMCGNPEAEASAYSLHDYDIAQELGGWEALTNLRNRAWRYGIRLASDMVPNHTGIDSRWISEHPDWYLQLDHPPYPGYTFNGANLSRDPNIGVYLEDHYYNQSDAAVVFKHVDFHTGQQRYIYHGNDGTHMPWNDTAQLNYLNPEVREAIIQTILHVARNFPIIRFDAAMTLAKKHIQRLWFPEPGSGGDIASRAEFGMTKADFDKAMPVEFWREVVDRVAQEVPDTLLLAEAFWMMEGYFVRTLGMHRVYNSAFMHMFKNEDNAKYRYTIKNTLEFDPQILKRFVNFMNNPDEETASEQFGDGDKYFGVCTMMVTMPGTPMFGHGQIEGFREKYGMEYRKAYWEELPNDHLRHRHEAEIFPLMKKRYLFAEVEHFHLYDLWTSDGQVNENVFAYTNQAGFEKALVLFNNSYHRAMGWLNTSVGFSVKNSHGKEVQQIHLAKALGLTSGDEKILIMREHNSNLWYLRRSKDIIESGLFVGLEGYEKQVFLDIQEIADNESGHYRQLCANLNGRGTPNIEEALQDMLLSPLYTAFHDLFHVGHLESLLPLIYKPEEFEEKVDQLFHEPLKAFYYQAKVFSQGKGNPESCALEVLAKLKSLPRMTTLTRVFAKSKAKGVKLILDGLRDMDTIDLTSILFSWIILGDLGCLAKSVDSGTLSRGLLDEWFLERKLSKVFQNMGVRYPNAAQLVKVLVLHKNWFKSESKQNISYSILTRLFRDNECRSLFGTNVYDDIIWFNRESFKNSLNWFLFTSLFSEIKLDMEKGEIQKIISQFYKIINPWLDGLDESQYQVEKLLSLVNANT